MPEMSAAQRGSGAWSAAGSLAPATPVQGRYDAPCDALGCGATPTRAYNIGRCCQEHTPAAVAGHPETRPNPELSVEGLRTRALPVPDQSRYGRATTDPLGREGPGWHHGKQSGLPTRDKGDSK